MNAEQLAAIQTPEYQEHLRQLVEEPGQVTLAHKFFSHSFFPNLCEPLTPMEISILKKCAGPLSSDWEDKLSIGEMGDEICAAYGILTLRGLITWEFKTGKWSWIVCEITPLGQETLTRIQA